MGREARGREEGEQGREEESDGIKADTVQKATVGS